MAGVRCDRCGHVRDDVARVDFLCSEGRWSGEVCEPCADELLYEIDKDVPPWAMDLHGLQQE